MANIIRKGDSVMYKPTGTIFTVKEIYAGDHKGKFNCAGGEMEFASAILIFYGDSGHYPVDKDIILISKERNFD